MQARSLSWQFCEYAAMGQIGIVKPTGLQILHGIAEVAGERRVGTRH
jgi:hypothetical protein